MRHIHCVGIGGIGISAIARVLLERGVRISGSDARLSPAALSLAQAGAVVMAGHNAAHLGSPDAVLISSAVPPDNPEVVEARRRGIPVFKRAEFLGQLMADQIGVAVAGTHGKTTTTALIAWILAQAGLDPTFIVGGMVSQWGVNARAGHGPHFVIEADEYDHMFLGLRPTVAAVTHLEHDHPDCFPTWDDMRRAFEQFLALVPANGLIVGCGDQAHVVALLTQQAALGGAPVQTCGLAASNDWQAVEVEPDSGGHRFQVIRHGQLWGSASLSIPGIHNVQNTLIAIAIADWLGVTAADIAGALASFGGTERRFQVRGEVGGITVIDDYGHHPTEIVATLAAARARYGRRPLWAIFQPHTYSRTRALWNEFLACFAQADHVIVLDIYAAREQDTLGISAGALAAELSARHPDAHFIADFDQAAQYIIQHAEPQAVIITLSAGDGNRVGELVLEKHVV